MRAFLLIAALFAIQSVQAQFLKYSNEFLAIGTGARALALGGSNVATVNDVTSGYWNPAGLASLESPLQATLMHAEYFAGISKYDYGAVAKTLDSNSAVALSVIRFGTDDIPNTINLINSNGQIDYNAITRFSAQDWAFIGSYARKIKRLPGLSLGANMKVVRRTIGDFGGSWGVGIDVGLRYTKGNWMFGVCGRDVTTTYNAWSYTIDERTREVFTQTQNDIPVNSIELTAPKLVYAAAYSKRYKKFGGLLETNVVMTTDGMRNVLIKSEPFSFDPQVGIELDYDRLVYLRGGINNIQTIREAGRESLVLQPNFGVGVRIFSVFLDYALTNVGQQTGLLSHVFSLKVHIKPRTAS